MTHTIPLTAQQILKDKTNLLQVSFQVDSTERNMDDGPQFPIFSQQFQSITGTGDVYDLYFTTSS